MRSISTFSADSPVYALNQEVQRQFIEWRQATPRGFRRIPEKLWNSATKLAAATTVFQVSKFLGLDYSLLKKRVVALCGSNCPALPGRRQRNQASGKSPFSTTFQVNNSQVNCHHSMEALPSAISQFPQDGFIEATVAATQPWAGPPLLAEIRSPKGALMRLFSVDTIPIIQTFLQS